MAIALTVVALLASLIPSLRAVRIRPGMALRYEWMISAMLHITNGESVIRSFRASSIPGSYLSWMDVLHDGPVPYTSSLDELVLKRCSSLGGEVMKRFDQRSLRAIAPP